MIISSNISPLPEEVFSIIAQQLGTSIIPFGLTCSANNKLVKQEELTKTYRVGLLALKTGATLCESLLLGPKLFLRSETLRIKELYYLNSNVSQTKTFSEQMNTFTGDNLHSNLRNWYFLLLRTGFQSRHVDPDSKGKYNFCPNCIHIFEQNLSCLNELDLENKILKVPQKFQELHLIVIAKAMAKFNLAKAQSIIHQAFELAKNEFPGTLSFAYIIDTLNLLDCKKEAYDAIVHVEQILKQHRASMEDFIFLASAAIKMDKEKALDLVDQSIKTEIPVVFTIFYEEYNLYYNILTSILLKIDLNESLELIQNMNGSIDKLSLLSRIFLLLDKDHDKALVKQHILSLGKLNINDHIAKDSHTLKTLCLASPETVHAFLENISDPDKQKEYVDTCVKIAEIIGRL